MITVNNFMKLKYYQNNKIAFSREKKMKTGKKILSFRILEFTMHWLFFHQENAFTRASKLFYEKSNRRVPRE